MRLTRRQAGMGFIGSLFVIALLGFVAMFLLRLVPVYMEYFTIRSVLHGFEGDPNQYSSSEALRQALAKRFEINDVRSVSASDIVIEPTDQGYGMQLDYEARVPFIANLSFVVNFSETGEVRQAQ